MTAPAPTKTTSHTCAALAQALQSKCLPKLAAEARTIQYAFVEQEKRIRELEDSLRGLLTWTEQTATHFLNEDAMPKGLERWHEVLDGAK